METHDLDGSHRPTQQEADTALRAAKEIHDSMASEPVPLPWWYFPALAATVAAVALVQLLPGIATVVATIALAASLGMIVGAGVSKARYTPRVRSMAVLPFVAVMLGIWAVASVMDFVYDRQWQWWIVALTGAGLILAAGAYHRRMISRSAP